jgi:hypothetical protein
VGRTSENSVYAKFADTPGRAFARRTSENSSPTFFGEQRAQRRLSTTRRSVPHLALALDP